MQETITPTPPSANDDETLAQTAEREAGQAEGEHAGGNGVTAPGEASTPEPTDAGADVSIVGEAPEPEPEVGYQRAEPSQEDLTRAVQALARLRAEEPPKDETALLDLLAIVDVHRDYTREEEWPTATDDEYAAAPMLARLGEILADTFSKLAPLEGAEIVYLWRNKAKWTARGNTVRSATKALDTRTQFLAYGKTIAIDVNFHHWKTLNPLQKIFTLHHALREVDGKGGVRHPDFDGYFDELEVFGPRVFRDMARLAASISRGNERALPHQLSIFDDGDED